MADAHDSKSCESNLVRVRLPPRPVKKQFREGSLTSFARVLRSPELVEGCRQCPTSGRLKFSLLLFCFYGMNGRRLRAKFTPEVQLRIFFC